MLDTVLLNKLSERELLSLYSNLMEELRNRELTRTSNNPTADFAEKVAVEKLGLTRTSKEVRGYDATDKKNHKYQIKGRRITLHSKSRQLGVIRNLKERLFDYVIAVIFDESFNVQEMWKIPFEFIKNNSKWSAHQNGHNIYYASQLCRTRNR